MAISCTYCGGQHAHVDDVRSCWERGRGTPATPTPATVAPPAAPGPSPRRATLNSLRGPAVLGRHVVLSPGQDVPPAWSAVPRLRVDAGVLAQPEPSLDALRKHHDQRDSVVIELAVPFDDRPRETEARPPHAVGARFRFPLDELFHLVWCNSVDMRAATPRWPLVDAALAQGATMGGPADVVLPDGRPAWLDGGPVRHTAPIEGVDVVHAVGVEHGSLRPLGDRTTSAELAADQRAAVLHEGGSARIIAPAGSGKTRVLTERARHLVTGWGLPASAVGLVAFNRRAQHEMSARTTDLPGLQVRTLNSLALAIVNGTPPFAPTGRRWQTIDERDVRRLLGRLVDVPARRNQDPFAPWIEALGAVRLGLADPDEVEARYDGDVAGLGQVWPRYRQELERNGWLDFDAQIYRALELLLSAPDVRAVAQHACRVLLVDEFQDLTPAHLLLVRLLAAPGGAVFGVGDDDQTIYGYNGADPAWLIDFTALFPGSGDHPLEVNYRCPGGIVSAADRLLRRNTRRVPKQVRSAAPERDGLVIDGATEGGAGTVALTLGHVQGPLSEGRRPGEIAVLTRVNALLAPVQAGLVEAGVPIQGGVGGDFLAHPSVRAALAWLRLALSDERLDGDDLGEALRRPSRPLHPQVAEWVKEQASVASLRRLAGRLHQERDAQRVEAFASDLDRLSRLARRGSTTAHLLRVLVDEVGLGGAVATLDHTRHGMNRPAQRDDLTALVQLAELHPEPSTFERWLTEVLGAAQRADGVTLATVHRVKGQEWPVVVVHHATDDQFPHRLADDVEEERRIFHVAITRAAERAIVVAGASPSPFVRELTTEPGPGDLDSPARPAVTSAAAASTAVRSRRPAGASEAPGGGLAGATAVVAVPGLVLVDGGRDWLVTAVAPDHAEARQGAARRRFAVGEKVVTAGRQRGPLAIPRPDSPPAASVRAFDLLRQRREILRDGKPAYVVFDDATLERIALALPADLGALSAIRGVGPHKLEAYGDDVLVVIEDARQETPSNAATP